ncbi:hypothetical protein Tco_1009272 [Tanacetum coccineum]
MARQCTQPKRPRNEAWYKDKAMLVEAQEVGQILDEEQLAFLAELVVPYGQAAQQDSMILFVIKQMSRQMIIHVNNWEKANKEQNNESVTAELERYKERVKTFEQRLNIDLSSREKMIDSQMDDMIKEKLALKEQVDSLEQNLSKQIKEKECLLQKFTFDSVVKKRTTLDARTEDLLNENMEVQTVCDQMDATVQRSLVDKQCLEIAKKELLLENDRLLQKIMSQDVLLTVVNSMSLIGEYVNIERKQNEFYDKFFNLDVEF